MNNIVNLIYEAAVVKRLKRTGWQILGDNEESIGEHSFMTAVIVLFLAKEVKNDKPVNIEKVLTMSILHDFHEARTGDVDKIATFYITRDERKANRDIFQSVDLGIVTTLDEYEQKNSLEAKIVYEANIIALLVELKILVEKGNVHAQEWLMEDAKRLRLSQSKQLAQTIITTDSHDWWKDIRNKLREEFSK
jgi:putative hydrolase of HD superfamily